MNERICFSCIHWCVCCRHLAKSRKYQIWKAPERVNDFYRLAAENCDDWLEDVRIKAGVEEYKLLKKIITLLETGKLVAVQKNGIGPVDFLGSFSDEREAQKFNKDHQAIILKAVAKKE